jgi:hypothetical protein
MNEVDEVNKLINEFHNEVEWFECVLKEERDKMFIGSGEDVVLKEEKE